MGTRKKEDNTILTKKTDEKQDSTTIMISADEKRQFFQ